MRVVPVHSMPADVWTNQCLRRALKVLERVTDDSDELPPIQAVRGEIRALLKRRRQERIGMRGPR